MWRIWNPQKEVLNPTTIFFDHRDSQIIIMTSLNFKPVLLCISCCFRLGNFKKHTALRNQEQN